MFHASLLLKQSNKANQCLRLFTRKHKPLTKVGELNKSALEDETPRESDWSCQSIPWSLYTGIEYVHVCTESTNTV